METREQNSDFDMAQESSRQGENLMAVVAASSRATEAGPSDSEVALLTDGRPSTTGELVHMLKSAGTGLTVKYITGEISFEDFCMELEKVKPTEKQKKPVSETGSAAVGTSTMDLPAFDMLLEDEEGEEEDEEDVKDEDENDGEWEADDEFADAGETMDKKDGEWIPEGGTKKKDKGKGGKTKGSQKGKKSQEPVQKKPRKRRRRPFELPKELTPASGQAMLLRAQGKTDEASKILFDIISKAPKAAAPYEALGAIHEEEGDLQQALKFFMVAANLRGSYATEWMDLVDMCATLKDDKLAHTCFARAMKVSKTNKAKMEIMSKKSAYYEQHQLPYKAVQCREQMLTYMDKSQPSTILPLARSIATDYMEDKDEAGAISVLQYICKELPNDIDSEDVHNLAELLMSQKSYIKCAEVIIRHCGVDVTFDGEVPSPEELPPTLENFANKEATMDSLDFPALMPVDLRSKLVQSLVLTKALPTLDVMKKLIKSLTETDVEDYGDIHYDIAETMVECGYHEEARPILHGLVHSVQYNKAAVWLTYGQCLNALGDIKSAADAYTIVVEMAPGHYEARVTLSSLLQQMGHNDVALEVLSKGPEEEGVASEDQLLLLHKCQLLHSQGKMDEFVAAGHKLLSYSFPGQCNKDIIKVLMSVRTTKTRKSIVQIVSGKKPVSAVEPETSEEGGESKEKKLGEEKRFRESLWDLYVKLCRELHDRGQTNELLEIATLGMTCPTFARDEKITKDAEFLCLKIGPVNIDIYHLVRNLLQEERENNQAWNLYSYIVTRLKEVTDLRFLIRALMKYPDSIALGILNGNARLISGTYKQAIGEYLSVLRQSPENSMLLLCSGLCLVHIASQTFTSKKNILILQAVCLLKAYMELRGQCQETFYNLGRAMQQLDIMYAAVYYYKKALDCPPMVDDGEGTFDLRCEIAYSLAQIYMKSKNEDYARYYIEKYCVI